MPSSQWKCLPGLGRECFGLNRLARDDEHSGDYKILLINNKSRVQRNPRYTLEITVRWETSGDRRFKRWELKPNEWAQIFSAAFTALIALITTTILVQQHQLARRKLRHELYDRRFAIYNALMGFLNLVIQEGGQLSVEVLYKFKADTNQAFFLFDRDVREYLDEVYARAVELRRKQKKAEEDSDDIKRFGDQFDKSRTKFAKYLMLKSLR